MGKQQILEEKGFFILPSELDVYKRQELTNPDKVIFKNPKVTKKDIFNYYEKVAKRMLPFIENRLISTIRLQIGRAHV